jgi:hypothetical protein
MMTETTPISAIAAELMNHDSNSSQSTLVMEDTGVSQEKVKRVCAMDIYKVYCYF